MGAQEQRWQAQEDQVNHPPLERPVGYALRPVLPLGHHAGQLRVLRKRNGRYVLPALALRHALGARHVIVVVEGQHHHVTRVVCLFQVPAKLSTDEPVPRLRLPRRRLFPSVSPAFVVLK